MKDWFLYLVINRISQNFMSCLFYSFSFLFLFFIFFFNLAITGSSMLVRAKQVIELLQCLNIRLENDF